MNAGSFSRTSRIVVAVVLTLAALTIAESAYTVWREHEDAIARAERDTRNATAVLAEHAARTFDGVARALGAVVDLRAEVELGAVSGAVAIHDALRAIQGGSPVILGIGWTDAAGNRVASSLFRDPPPLNIADQEPFRFHSATPTAELHVAAPFRSRVDGTWILPVSRRLVDPSGRFAGIANAVLRLDYFLDLYRAVYLGPGTGVVLARSDGMVLVRVPMVEDWIGRSLVGHLMFQGRPIGTTPVNLHAVSPIDGRSRILGYRATSEFPLVIAATMLRSDALAPFYEVLVFETIEVVLTVAALFAGGFVIVLAVRRREAAGRELEESGALLESVFAATNRAIIVFDRDRRAVAWNELCADYFGEALALGKGAPLHAMLQALAVDGEYGTRDVDASVAERLGAAHAGRPVRYERERPNGTVMEVSWLPLPNGFLAIAHTDITHLKRAEKALRESEARAAQTLARFKDAIDSLADPFFLWDAEERLVLANKAATDGPGGDMLTPGIPLAEAISLGVRRGSFPVSAGREEAFIAERVAQIRRATGEVVEIERADGTWLTAWDQRTRDGGIVSLRVDISALKRTEMALRESEARAAAASQRLVDAIDALEDAFFLWDAQERLIHANKAAARGPGGEMLRPGISLEEVVRHRVRAGRFPVPAEKVEAFADWRLEQARRATGEPSEVQLADGSWISLRDLRTREGGLVTLAVDITEAKAREAELAQARQAADAASRAKSDFLSRMSHELRTPLNAVIGFAQMLQLDRSGGMTDRQRDYCRDIENGGRYLLALVNDVLDLARIESGKDRMSLERVVVADALASLRTAMAALAEREGIRLRVGDGAGVPDLRADDLRLHQILLNLVSNAIKYNRPGGSVDVTAAERPGELVRIAVADTGIGIAESRREELFEPFRRLGQEYSGIDGTGIGLAICKRLAEAMGGAIGVESEVGRGSTFWIDLPRDRAAAAAPSAVAATSAEAPASPPVYPSGFSVLYVEDNPSNMRLMEHLISTLPRVALLAAPTPRLGLDLARTHRPDLILLDLHLPGMNGYELLARLKAMPETAEIPVIALTAAAMPSDIRRGLAAGFFRYLTKPIDVKEFLEAICECLPAACQEEETRQPAG